jgi:hypothetical protein
VKSPAIKAREWVAKECPHSLAIHSFAHPQNREPSTQSVKYSAPNSSFTREESFKLQHAIVHEG